jgi:predicted permease
MDGFIQDLRHAARLLAKSPGFVITAAVVLGLGVGANTAIFTLVNGLFLRPLPVPQADRLAWVTAITPPSSRLMNLSYPDYLDLRERNQVFTGLLAYDEIPVALAGGGAPQRVHGAIVSGNYFSVLGVKPALGRAFGPDEDAAPGAAPVAVISHALWKKRFGSDPELVGRSLLLSGHEFTVLGIAPKSFTGTEAEGTVDVWVPLAMHAEVMPGSRTLLAARDAGWLRVMGRLKPGVTPAQARSNLTVLVEGIRHSTPVQREGMTLQLTPATGTIHPTIAGEALSIVILLMAVTGLILMIACGNVANLLLSRAAARGREMGIRLALGATRARLVRQLLTESLLLSLVGGAAGLAMASWGTDLLLAFAEIPNDLAGSMSPDLRVFSFTLALSILSGVFFGLAPALHASRRDLAPVLKGDGSAPQHEGGKARPQRLLVVSQVALSMVLLVSAGLFLGSLSKSARVDPGYDVQEGLTLSFDLNLQGYSRDKSVVFTRELLQRVEALPGVASATLASLAPLSGRMLGSQLTEESAAGEEGRGLGVSMNAVYPGYFRTLGIPILKGREFTDRDGPGAPETAIVNQECARRLWPDQEALGRRISLNGAQGPFAEVIGVAQDAKYDELSESPRPFVYLSHFQSPDLLSELALLVRAKERPANLLTAVQHELRSMDANLPIYDVSTLAGTLRLRSDKQRGMTKLLSLFSALALLLASVGLYGVLAFSVQRRTREIGIRMALGARRGDILGMLIGEGLRLTLWGVGVGLVLSVGLTRLLSGMLFGVAPADLATIAGVSLLLAAVGVAASSLPARRATRIDPMLALRHD